MHSFVTSKNVKWCHLIWPTLYIRKTDGIVFVVHMYRNYRPTTPKFAPAAPLFAIKLLKLSQ